VEENEEEEDEKEEEEDKEEERRIFSAGRVLVLNNPRAVYVTPPSPSPSFLVMPCGYWNPVCTPPGLLSCMSIT